MNKADENTKAPITRVFNLSGLRKQNQKKNFNESSLIIAAKKFDEENTTVEKKVYIVRDLSINLNNPSEESFKSENKNIKLAPTPIKSPIDGKLIQDKLNICNNYNSETNEIIAQHVSEIDLDDKYFSNKFNPVYKSDSEEDLDDYQSVYQDPTQVHPLKRQFSKELNEKKTITKENISVIEVNNLNDDEIYATINDNDIYLTPIQLKLDQQTLSVKEKYVKHVKTDMLKESIIIIMNKNDLLNNIAIVSLNDKLWIAGLSQALFKSQNSNRSIYIGDLIISINGNENLNKLKNVHDFINECKNQDICVKIKRLPFARVIFIPLVNSDVPTIVGKYNNKHVKSILGIKLDADKPRFEKIDESGLVYKNSLRFFPNSYLLDLMVKESIDLKSNFNEKSQLTTWTFTEINGILVNQSTNSDKVAELLFTTKDNEIFFIVQPTDLMKALCKELKKVYDNNLKIFSF